MKITTTTADDTQTTTIEMTKDMFNHFMGTALLRTQDEKLMNPPKGVKYLMAEIVYSTKSHGNSVFKLYITN